MKWGLRARVSIDGFCYGAALVTHAIANAPVEMGCAHESSAVGPFLMSASGSNRLLEVGQSMSAPPDISDINLFRYCEGIINLDAEISDRAFDFGMSEQKLDGPGGSIASAN
jgi:hypothetical protein